MHSSKATRFHYLDHTRGFVILLVALQHSIQSYAQMWGGGRYFHPAIIERAAAFDGLFMLTDSFIMQALFLVSGMFVLPSLDRRGWKSFFIEKSVRLVIPFFIAVFTLVPMLRYFKYIENIDPTASYFEFWFEIFPDQISPAGYWFLSFLVVLTFLTAIFSTFYPMIIPFFGHSISWLASKPIRGYLIFGAITAVLISISDLIWGTTFWFMPNIFISARWNMLFSFILFFFVGVGVREAGLLTDKKFLQKMSDNWKKWAGLTTVLGLVYVWYCQTYVYDGAFTNEVVYYFYQGGDWAGAWPLIFDVAPMVLIRTILHGFYCVAVTITIIIVLFEFTNGEHPFWTSLAACSYGIYFFHEQLVVWAQYWFIELGIPLIVKAALVFIIGVAGSWLWTDKVMRKAPVFKRVF